MSTKKPVKVKGTVKERDDKKLITCLLHHLVWSNYHQQLGNPSEIQYTKLPRALADEQGHPHTGNESTWTTEIASR